jgi:hypothetical protein
VNIITSKAFNMLLRAQRWAQRKVLRYGESLIRLSIFFSDPKNPRGEFS